MKFKPYNLQDVYDAAAQEKFKVISTFAGGGGSSTGYRLAGGKVLCINEFVEEARNTYAKNYPDTVILPGDIKELNGKDFLKAASYTSCKLYGLYITIIPISTYIHHSFSTFKINLRII